MISINEWMEDFDNSELPLEEWKEVLEDAIREYNDKYGTVYTVKAGYNGYLEYKRRKTL